jgi:hypothetical protein
MTQHFRSWRRLFALLTTCLAIGCSSGGRSTPYPYDPGTTNVIGATGTGRSDAGTAIGGSSDKPESITTGSVGVAPVATYSTPTDEKGCIQLEGQCLAPQKDCGADGTADVIVGPNGEPLSVICYPNHDYNVLVVGDAPAKAPPLGNNTVLVLDGVADGADIEGGLVIKGNNSIIYGQGPDVSVISGDLQVEKNNAIVRGVRIQGNASISKNNASLVNCVVEGNLEITGNNVNVALCEIWGQVKIEGQNAVFVSNLVEGEQPIEGNNLRCNDNHRFADANGDAAIQASEIGAAVSCISRGTTVADTTGLTPKK